MQNSKQLMINQLEKWYGNRRVFFNLCLTLGTGIHFLHGKNGSGKSTLLSILAGSNDQYNGEITLNNISAEQHKSYVKQIGYAPDKLNFFSDVNVADFIQFVKKHRQMRNDINLEMLCDAFNFEGNSTKQLSSLSLGNAKKLLLITALMIEAELYLFDEPLNGLDVKGKTAFIELISTMENKIILITSHRSHDYQDLHSQSYAFEDLQLSS